MKKKYGIDTRLWSAPVRSAMTSIEAYMGAAGFSLKSIAKNPDDMFQVIRYVYEIDTDALAPIEERILQTQELIKRMDKGQRQILQDASRKRFYSLGRTGFSREARSGVVCRDRLEEVIRVMDRKSSAADLIMSPARAASAAGEIAPIKRYPVQPMKQIDVNDRELRIAESAFCFVVMNLSKKPKKGAVSRALNKWIRSTPERQMRFSPPDCTPNRRGQSLVAIYRYWKESNPSLLSGWVEPRLAGTTTNAGSCKRKTRAGDGECQRYSRDSAASFYKSWDWRTLRMKALKERGRRCECCGATPYHKDMNGDPVKICVDHIKPLSKYWDLRLDKTNLQILCDECNQGKGAWDQTDWRADNQNDILEYDNDSIPDNLKEQLHYSI